MAQTALLAAGFEVAEPVAPEVYDLIIRNPKTGEYKRVQVKTVRVRDDRDGALVLYARKSNGEPYTTEETDLFAGVHGNDVYIFPCRGISEYWVNPDDAADKWTLISGDTWKVGGEQCLTG